MTYPVLNDYQNKPIFHHLRSYILHCLQQIYTSWPLCASMMLNEVPFSSILLNCIQLPQAYLVGQKLTQVSSRCIGYVILDKHFQSCLILDQAEVLGKRVVVSAYPFGRTIRMGVLIFRGQGLWELYDSICDQRNERWAHGLFSPLDFLWLSDVAYSTEYSHQSTNSPEFTIVYAIHPYYGRLCPQSCHEF